MPKKAKLVIPMPESCSRCPIRYESAQGEDRCCITENVAERKEGKNFDCPLEEVFVSEEYDPEFGDNKECECGHSYYRHFDSYEDMAPVGCKYCNCHEFKEKK